MPLTAGTRVGPFEIVSLIGAGGMGEVYRARDTKLGRDVAIKILPPIFAADAERRARFEREAQTLATLNHPHIAQIYGVVEEAAALVMEFVDGEDLAQRLTRGSLPLDDAILIARQMADALEAAHERGIVHRDLKPANVKVAPDGTVKVLDFGLAKAIEGPGGVGLANSPTFTSPAVMTHAGVILGTAAYMAPEQARGKTVDRRADIWAFGCVCYEMLTGAKPFAGESVTDVLSAIVSKDPDWSRAPPAAPPALLALLMRCLEKDPRRRLRDIGEARVLLEQPLDGVSAAAPGATKPPRALALLGLAGGLFAVAAAGVLLTRARPAPATRGPLTRYDVQLPDKASLDIVFRPAVSISADGSVFAFAASSDGVDRVYVRARGDVTPRVLPSTEGGTSIALSPDGKTVAFFADGAVRKAPVDGGGPVGVSPARDVRGMAWTAASTLVFAADSAGPLMSVESSGGEVRPVTTLAAGERTHRWPGALPGGQAVLFTVGTLDKPDTYDQGNIDIVILATRERRVAIKGAAMARYCGGGRIVYSKGTSLYAVPFDPERLQVTGTPVEIVQGVERDASTGAAHFACSEEGTLSYIPGSAAGDLRLLTWMDRHGTAEAVKLPPGVFQEARVSPDGTRVALLVGTAGAGDVWIHEFTAGTFTRLTFTGNCAAPIWSTDGRLVYYTMFDPSGTRSTIARKPADGSRDAETLRSVDGRGYLMQIDDAHGAVLMDSVVTSSDRGDIVRVPLAASDAPQPIVASPFNEFNASISPGGQWIAYQSDDTGRPEVYVRDLSGAGARYQVTTTGGGEPRWSRDGRELYYHQSGRLMAMPIERGATFRAGLATPLFDGIYSSGIESGRSFDVDPATGRFLLVVRARPTPSTGTVRVVLNWDAAVRQP